MSYLNIPPLCYRMCKIFIMYTDLYRKVADISNSYEEIICSDRRTGTTKTVYLLLRSGDMLMFLTITRYKRINFLTWWSWNWQNFAREFRGFFFYFYQMINTKTSSPGVMFIIMVVPFLVIITKHSDFSDSWSRIEKIILNWIHHFILIIHTLKLCHL